MAQTAAIAETYRVWMSGNGLAPLAQLRALTEIGGLRLPPAMLTAARRSWALDDAAHLIAWPRDENAADLRAALLAELDDPAAFVAGRWDKLRALAAKQETRRLADKALGATADALVSHLRFAVATALLEDVPALAAALTTCRETLPADGQGPTLRRYADEILGQVGA